MADANRGPRDRVDADAFTPHDAYALHEGGRRAEPERRRRPIAAGYLLRAQVSGDDETGQAPKEVARDVALRSSASFRVAGLDRCPGFHGHLAPRQISAVASFRTVKAIVGFVWQKTLAVLAGRVG